MASQQITVTLSDERDVEFLHSVVSEGVYPSEDAAITDFIALQREEKQEFERYLKDVVLPRYDAAKADPNAFLTGDQVREHLENARKLRADRAG